MGRNERALTWKKQNATMVNYRRKQGSRKDVQTQTQVLIIVLTRGLRLLARARAQAKSFTL